MGDSGIVAGCLSENLKTYGTTNEFLHNEVLCDVILQSNITDFPAHLLILVSTSDIFKVMFTLPMRERTSKRLRINEPTFSDIHLAQLLNLLFANLSSNSRGTA